MPGGEGHPDGAQLVSTAANGFTVLSDTETGKRLWRTKLKAGGNALLSLGWEKFAVGDDEGGLSIYDGRSKKPAVQWAENSDFISDLALSSDAQKLCATSGDGTLAIYDIRTSGEKGLIAMSDFLEDEYLCLTVLKSNNKERVICGSQTGTLAIFKWGDFGDMKDRIKGPKFSIDTLVKLTEESILTGSSDGKIRVVSVYHNEHQNSILGYFAEHGETPIDGLALSPDRQLLASCAHEKPQIRIWPIEVAHKMLAARRGSTGDTDPEDSDDSDSERPKKRCKKKKRKTIKKEVERKARGFFAGM